MKVTKPPEDRIDTSTPYGFVTPRTPKPPAPDSETMRRVVRAELAEVYETLHELASQNRDLSDRMTRFEEAQQQLLKAVGIGRRASGTKSVRVSERPSGLSDRDIVVGREYLTELYSPDAPGGRYTACVRILYAKEMKSGEPGWVAMRYSHLKEGESPRQLMPRPASAFVEKPKDWVPVGGPQGDSD